MDFTSAWFLLVMVVVGGIIAVLADNLGRKLGKSRLRLGKLRPRHTAMLFTAVTGAVVTLTTIILVSVLSAEVREWIIRGREAVKESTVLATSLTTMEAEFEKSRKRLNTVLEELDDQSKRIENQRRQIELQKGRVTSAERQAGTAEAHAAEVTSNLREREKRLKEMTSKLTEASGKLTSVQAKMVKLNETYQKLSTNYKQLDINYAKLTDDIKASHEQDRILRQQNMDLEKENLNLEKDISNLTAQINSGVTQLGDLSSRIRAQEENLSSLMRTASGYREGAIGARTRPIIFNMGQEIARRDIGLSLTYADAERHVRSTINLAAEEVYRRASIGVGLREVMQRTHTSNEIVGILARQLTDSQGPATIIVRTSTNVFGDEEGVPIEVEIRSNPVVFKRGETLGEVRIPDGQSVDEIIEAITGMLETQVRAKAADARMHGTENPSANIGRIDSAETIKVVNAIREAGRPVRVIAVAKTETRASGPLEIEFRVR